MTLTKEPSWKVGLLQAIFVLCYVLFFALTVNGLHDWLGDFELNPAIGMSLFLTTFVFSALVCGGAVVGYPLVLLSEKNTRRAVAIICWSAAWFAAFLSAALVIGIGMSL